nr:hypothetical protein [Endozoicomonas sp.]
MTNIINQPSCQHHRLPHFGQTKRDADYVYSKNENGERRPFFGGFSVSSLSDSKNKVDILRQRSLLCIHCDGVMRDPVRTPHNQRSCRPCMAHWIYLSQSDVGAVLSPKNGEPTHNQPGASFTIKECPTDSNYMNNKSREIYFQSCPVKNITACTWGGGNLYDLNKHVKKHSDLEAAGRIEDYYQKKRDTTGADNFVCVDKRLFSDLSEADLATVKKRSDSGSSFIKPVIPNDEADCELSDTENELSEYGAVGYSTSRGASSDLATSEVYPYRPDSRAESDQSVRLQLAYGNRRDLLRLMFTRVSEDSLNLIYTVLNRERNKLRGESLEELNISECREFVTRRLSVRGACGKGLVHSLFNKELSYDQVSEIFNEYEIEAERELSVYAYSPACEKTTERTQETDETRFYRFGTFTCEQDEQGRVINSKLGRVTFQQDTVNQQGTTDGYGLYAAENQRSCLHLRRASYNCGKRVVVLEIIPQPRLPLIDVKPPSGMIEDIARYVKRTEASYPSTLVGSVCRAVLRDRCHFVGAIYKPNASHRLIKDASSIKKIKAFHPDMHTKVHVPFTRADIERERLRIVEVPREYIQTFETAPTLLKSCRVYDACNEQVQERDIYKYSIHLKNEQLINQRGLSRGQYYEDKYYLVEPASTSGRMKYMRVKPEAPMNTHGLWQSYANPDDAKEFHLQYHRNDGTKNRTIPEPSGFATSQNQTALAWGLGGGISCTIV